jgi:transglutaminase-like putative cysteine protease
MSVRNAFVSLILFFLLWEWMRPLIELSRMTDLYIVEPFLIAIGGFILIDYVRIPYWIGWPIKFLLCLSIIGYFFHQNFLIDLQWWGQYAEITIRDGLSLIRGEYGLSAENRTLLFLLGWSFMISAVQSLMISRHSSGFFIAATLMYLIILQLWVGLDTTAGIMRSLGLGMILLSVLNLPKIERVYKVSANSVSWPQSWVAVTFIIVTISMVAGVYLSRTGDKEIKPFDWKSLQTFEWFSDVSSKPQPAFIGETAKSGYGNDDSKLGGSVVPNEEIVFTAKTTEITYWRGEAKSHYDGKGWTRNEHSLSAVGKSSLDPGGFIEQEVLMSEGYSGSLLFTGGLASDFQAIITGDGQILEGKDVLLDQESGRYSLNSNEVVSYYKVKVLRDPFMSFQEIDSSLQHNLQLPDTLPDRVRRLSEEIIGTTQDSLKRATLIESYLKNNYTYNLEDPVYPPADQDFVDHFLFEQGFGYCDHFSTAMVIMLRTLGIPARWVKGYSSGEITAENSDHLERLSFDNPRVTHSVVVRNLDAHSWVEVYIPEQGWTTFEPTPGFDANPSLQTIVMDKNAVNDHQNLWNKIQNKSSALYNLRGKIDLPLLIIMCSVIVLLILAYKRMKKEWLFRDKLNLIYKSGKRSDAMIRLFESMWLKIFRRFGSIQPSQTIREYIEGLDIKDQSQYEALVQFASMYESTRYNSLQRNWINKQAILRVWKRI